MMFKKIKLLKLNHRMTLIKQQALNMTTWILMVTICQHKLSLNVLKLKLDLKRKKGP